MSFNVNRNSIPFADCDEIDDLLTESQENLARSHTNAVTRQKSLGERRNKDVNLTVIVENETNHKV